MDELRDLARWSAERSIPSAVAASVLAVAVLILGPLMLGQAPTERFLLWNLALAWIPFVASLWVEALDAAGRVRLAVLCGAFWLLFLPNAPYLLSDFSHFDHASATPWLDLARLVAFGWAGVLLGLTSLRIVHRVVAARLGELAGWGVVLAAAVASGIGIALGRFARLNSWELVTRPTAVAGEALRLGGNSRVVAVAMFFAALILVMYLALGAEGAVRRFGMPGGRRPQT
jgi:uncharacterized membrane protein